MGTFNFNLFPANFNVPGTYVEYDGSKAQQGVSTVPQKVLLIGQMLAAGVATPGVPILAVSEPESGRLAGRGSMLHLMAKAHFDAAPFIPLYLMPLADAGSSTASTRTVTPSGTTTEAGTIGLYVGGRAYPVTVASGIAAAAVATAIAAVINADELRLVDATVATAVITLTARNKGLDAGKISCVLNRYAEERLPAGITIAIGALTAGAGNPVISAPIDAIPDQWYPTLVEPYIDSVNLAYLATELESRNGPVRQIEGVAFVGINDSVANQLTFATARNHPFIAPVDTFNSLAPAYMVAAAAAAAAALSAQNDPAQPEQTLPLPGLLAISETAGRRTANERNLLINGGVGTLTVDAGGVLRLERLTTSYRLNFYGVRDETRFDVCHERIWAQTRYSVRQHFTTRYPRHKLGKDGSRGPNVMTPSLAASAAIVIYTQFMDNGWYEGGIAFEQFKADLRAEVDTGNPNRLNLLFPPDFMNQLRVVGVLVQPVG